MRWRRRKPDRVPGVRVSLDFAKDGVPVFYLLPSRTERDQGFAREFAQAWMRAVLQSPERSEFVEEESQG